jgi:hypothetical protein
VGRPQDKSVAFGTSAPIGDAEEAHGVLVDPVQECSANCDYDDHDKRVYQTQTGDHRRSSSATGKGQRVPSSFRRWIRRARASYFVAVDVKVSIELGVASLLASLRARCAFSRHDHSMSCRSSTVKWHGTSRGFADDEVVIEAV